MKRDERGIALVITLFLMATLSALAVSMMFLAQTETASSRNYRTMSQARYAAEAGVHAMANYLMSSAYITGAAPASPYTGYDTTKVPVTCTSGCGTTTTASCDGSTIAKAVSTGCIVVGYSAATSNNPASTTTARASGTLATNSSGTTSNAAMGTATYTAAAILMSIKQINVYGGSPASVMTWQIIADGTVPPSTAAIVEVSSTVEQEIGQAETFAVYATNPNCSAITISGSVNTDSFTAFTPGVAPTIPSPPTGGGIGTNGNLNVSGGSQLTINGTLTTPRTGAGACTNSSVDAITGTGRWSYQGTDQISQSLSFDTPVIPTGIPTTPVSIDSSDSSSTCTNKLSPGWNCTVVSATKTVTLTPVTSTTLTLGNVSIASNTNVVIAGGSNVVLDVNSFLVGNNGTLTLSTGTNVTMNIAGQSLGSLKPLDLSGGGTFNKTYDSSRFQIMYAGTDEIDLVGNNDIAATIYAPNAFVKDTGNGNLYGSVLSSTFTDTGGAQIHYDNNLKKKFSTLGNYMLTSFSWKKY